MTNQELINNLKQLKGLEAGGRPQEAWVLASRQTLMSQINPQSSRRTNRDEAVYYWQYFSSVFKQRVFQPVGAFLVVVFALLTYNATASVASASLPGDMLYPIKTAGEKVQLAMTFNDEEKVKLQMNFVSRRVDELQLIAIQENDNKKSEKIAQTAKKITEDSKVLKESLGKISMAADKSAVVEVAKEVDAKTLEVKQNISLVQNTLPEAVKNEVKDEVKAALVSTEEAGTSALSVIVDNYNKGEVQISGDEVAARMAERIKSTEADISLISSDINNVLSVNKFATTTVTVSTSASSATMVLSLPGVSTTSTSALQNVVQKPQQAQGMIEEAKTLLNQKDFTSAMGKIQQSKDLVVDVVNSTENIAKEIQEVKPAVVPLTTTTIILLDSKNSASTTSTESTSESTKQLFRVVR